LRIKKLEIFGFKSFKDRTVIQFDAGITGIVGPNGCGKSNIVDALVWVMGEMSAKHLRGSSMEDVIFAGAEGYAPMGMAEVSLTLENDGGAFPAQYAKYSEVMITRALNRSGESDYYINKEPARLRDIQEIFMDTGAGSKGFSIIEQGAIGKIITAKAEDRRVLIEEAAGITKFKVRKRESQRKLESTDQNLVRLQDIIGEQKRHIDSLQRQAQRAERYRKIKTELQEKDTWLAAQNFLTMSEESRVAQNTFLEARDKDAAQAGRLSELELMLSEKKILLTEQASLVQDHQISHQDLLTQVQEAEYRIRELNMSIEQARRSKEMTGSMLAQHQLRRDNLVNEKENLDSRLQDLRTEVVLLESQFDKENSELTQVLDFSNNADQELSEKRREMLAVTVSVSQIEAREGVLNSKIESETLKAAQIQSLIQELTNKKADFEARRNSIYKELELERQMQFDITRDVDLIANQLEVVRTQISERRIEHDQFKNELNEVASRLYGLENMQSSFEGFEDGVKNILMWQRSKRNAVSQQQSLDESVTQDFSQDKASEIPAPAATSFKPLSEVVEVSEKYELAMEASLGTRLQLLLGDSSEQTLGAVDYLKSQKNGRSSFFSADTIASENISDNSNSVQAKDESLDNTLRNEPGFDSFLNEVVSVTDIEKPHIKQFVAQFFSDIVVVDSIRTALRLRTVYKNRTFVTLEGDTLGKDGVLTGGAIDSANSGVLTRRREIKELSLRREEFAGKVQLAQLTLNKYIAEEKGIVKQLEDAKITAVEKEIHVAGLKKDLERATVEFNQVEATLNREMQSEQQIEATLIDFRLKLNELSDQGVNLKARKTELDDQIALLITKLEESRTGIDELRARVTELKINRASKTQELESSSREFTLVDTSLSAISEQLTQMSEETERNSNTLTEGQVAVEELQLERQRRIHVVQESESNLGRVRNDFEKINAEVSEVEKELSQKSHEVKAIQHTMNEAQIKTEQLKMRETYLVDQMKERYFIDLNEVAHQFRDIPGSAGQYAIDIEELKNSLKKIGDVNLSAIQEYEEVIERYEFLTKQHEDLLEAKEHLKKVIDRINRICSRRFKDTFDLVNERFQKVFPVLFGGGEAMLVLVESKDAADPGIEIVARPPGKKLQNVTLLSGGEKALTAVSLIFSIFLVKPSPFCLLDEVDAPLDDANVMRFNDLVKEMAKRSQIIVVTHNKHTMKVNDKLYGVTMQEKGVSKMVSVSLADAEKMAQS
jgi:chromosome segregation protein